MDKDELIERITAILEGKEFEDVVSLDMVNDVRELLMFIRNHLQREEKIMETVHKILHSGLSIDQEVDQDYVCELIDKAVSEIVN